MQIKLEKKLSKKYDLVVVPIYEDGKKSPAGIKQIDDLITSQKFKGEEDKALLIATTGGKLPSKLLLLGLGKKKEMNEEKSRNAAATIIKKAKAEEATKLAVLHEKLEPAYVAQAVAEGFALANYQPAQYLTGENKKKADKKIVKEVTLIIASPEKGTKASLAKGLTVAAAVNKTRDLINAPHSHMDGTKLMNEAKKIAKTNKLKVSVLNKKQIEKLKMGAFLGVNKGSNTDANMVIMEHKPKGAKGKPIVLVGKGITFDSGGYNLKSGSWFKDMKMDMSGAAVVMNVLGLCGKLGIKRHIIGITPITDNLIGPKAQKVADIVTTYSGKTVEVTNTDAEGRLILCDAMAYAIKRYKPEALIDVATLTGACMMALGERYAGLFGNHQELIDKLKKASEETDELTWQLPIHADHTKEMKSAVADLQNVNYGNGGMAGASTAAAFLQEFVGKTHWAHLDIAGTAFVKNPKKYESPMGTGYGVRLLAHYLEYYA